MNNNEVLMAHLRGTMNRDDVALEFVANVDEDHYLMRFSPLPTRPDPSEPITFRWAVRLLEDLNDRPKPHQENSCRVSLISFTVDWRWLPPNDVDRLFRDVLPAIPALRAIFFDVNRLPARCLTLLVEALATSNDTRGLATLRFNLDKDKGPIDQASVQEVFQAIVDMMVRNVAKVLHLFISFPLDGHQSKVICQALSSNTNLRCLSIHDAEMSAPDALDRVASSSLEVLQITGSFTDDAVRFLATQLRTNETLLTLGLNVVEGSARIDSQALLELVKTYNWTLRSILSDLGSGRDNAAMIEQAEIYMHRNARIRDALQEVQQSDPDKRFVVPKELLPPVLGLVSDVPTVLFRILKLGGGLTISDHIVALQEAATASAAAAMGAHEPRRDPSPRRSSERQREAGEDGSAEAM